MYLQNDSVEKMNIQDYYEQMLHSRRHVICLSFMYVTIVSDSLAFKKGLKMNGILTNDI